VPDAHKNFAYSTVATAPSPGVSGTSLVVAAGDGVKFPTPPFNVTIWPIGVIPLTTNAEIARCTAISTDTLTLARAQEGSSARTVIIGDQVAATITAKTLTDVENQLIYGGDWAAGNYVDGQIVVYNGIAYLCTSPTAVAPSAWPGGVSPPAAPFTIPYGTSLPASPTDGQLAILVDSITNPTYQWEFRYNLGSTSAYKWEFVGGTPGVVNDMSDASVNLAATGTWYYFSPPINFTLPRAGQYLVTGSIRVFNNTGTANAQPYIGFANLWGGQHYISLEQGKGGHLHEEYVTTQSAAGVQTSLMIGTVIATGGYFCSMKSLQVTPMKVA